MDFTYSDRLKDLGGNAIREIFKLLEDPQVVSFAGGFPTIDSLPNKDIAEITSELLNSNKAGEILQYGGTEGWTPFRQTTCDYVKRFGINNAKIENTLIVSGGQQTIDLMCKAFLNKGDVVLVEDPTYLACLHIIKTYEGKAVGVKSNNDGLDIADLEAKIIKFKPKFLYVVPTFSNPTGNTYSVQNRIAIAELTAKYGLPVLEDDPYSRLRFSGEAVPCLKSFEKDNNILFTTSFSKIIAPGLRTAVAVGDAGLIRKLTIGKQAADVHTSSLSQAIINEYLKKGLLDPHIANIIPCYKTKKDAMLNTLDKFMPKEFSYTNPDGGLFIWREADKKCGFNAVKAFPELVKKYKVAYVSGHSFFADESGTNTLRLNYSNASVEQITNGIEKMCKFLQDCITKNQ